MLRVRIKTQPKESMMLKISLNDILKQYTNSLYNEINALLANYHSIQEHSNRAKIIEFCKKKLSDLDLLQVFSKGAYMNRKLELIMFKREDVCYHSSKINDMAGFIGVLYESMKESFLPVPCFELSLQSYIDHKKLLPDYITSSTAVDTHDLHNKELNGEDNKISDTDFEMIHRLMRIYLIKENIKNYVIEKGILTICSSFFEFQLALCGDIGNPQWHLFKVNSFLKHKAIEDQIQKRLQNIKQINEFIAFYESRKVASDLFNKLGSKQGYYQNFVGNLEEFSFKGTVTDKNFTCKVQGKGISKEFINPQFSDLSVYLMEHKEEIVHKCKTLIEYSKEYRGDVFGPNWTFVRKNLFFCLSKHRNVCYFGEVGQLVDIKYTSMCLSFNDMFSGTVYNKHSLNYRFGDNGQKLEEVLQTDSADLIFKTHLDSYVNFINNTVSFCGILNEIKDISFVATIKRCTGNDNMVSESEDKSMYALDGSFFTVDHNLHLYYRDMFNKTKVPIFCLSQKMLIQKIRLLHVQSCMKDSHVVVENKIGERLVVNVSGVKIQLTTTFKASLKYLAEDCKQFTSNQAVQYSINFGIFYYHNLMPDEIHLDCVSFTFSFILPESLVFYIENDEYKLKAEHSAIKNKIPASFGCGDKKVFEILYKFWLANRYLYLKSKFHIQDKQKEGESIEMKHGSITLTKEGLIYKNLEKEVNKDITIALNTDKDVDALLYNK